MLVICAADFGRSTGSNGDLRASHALKNNQLERVAGIPKHNSRQR
jgi:hypothetical protein